MNKVFNCLSFSFFSILALSLCVCVCVCVYLLPPLLRVTSHAFDLKITRTNYVVSLTMPKTNKSHSDSVIGTVVFFSHLAIVCLTVSNLNVFFFFFFDFCFICYSVFFFFFFFF